MMTIQVNKHQLIVVARGTDHEEALSIVARMKAAVRKEYPNQQVRFSDDVWGTEFQNETCAMYYAVQS
jgi:hypothetical protein